MSQKTQDNLKLYNLATTSIQSTSFIDNGEDIEPEVTVTIKEEPVDSEETEEYTEEYLGDFAFLLHYSFLDYQDLKT